jgi:hypothetical protein
MYKSVQRENGTFYLHMAEGGLKAVKGFTHGRVSFDATDRTIQFSSHPAIPMPDFDEVVSSGSIIRFGLVDSEGKLRSQRRDVTVQQSKDGKLYSAGLAQTPSSRSKDEGWRLRVLKFRAFFTHPGIDTDVPLGGTELPSWLNESIERQRRFRNRLVHLCAEARYNCKPVDYDAFQAFLKDTVLPAVDAFNDECGRVRTKDKISAKKLRKDKASIFHLTRFAGFLQYLEKDGKPVPEGLAKQIFNFANGVKLDFSPINEFERNIQKIIINERYLEDVSTEDFTDEESTVRTRKVYRRLSDPDEVEARRAELELRDWEWKPVAKGFISTLKRRKSMGMSFFEGWPMPLKPGRIDWGIHFYFNNGGTDASLLMERGVRGMTLKPGVSPEASGRDWKQEGHRAQRELNPVQISFKDTLSGQQFQFRFAVLRHKFPIPDGSLIKEWKLIYKKGSLWLCFVVEGKFANVKTNTGETAALHIGWRKEGHEIWPAMLYDPTRKAREAFHRVIVDTGRFPEDTAHRTPFRINMGPSRIGRRSPYWVTVAENSPVQRAEPDAQNAVQVQDTWAGIELLGGWRDSRKNIFKSFLATTLEPAPKGLTKAGVRTLHEIGRRLTDPSLAKLYEAWATEDDEIGKLMTEYADRVAGRLEKGYCAVAHDICKLLSEHGISILRVQAPLLAKVAQKKQKKEDDFDQAILEQSQKNRQHVAPGLLLSKVVALADTYGFHVEKAGNGFISRKHNNSQVECNHINPPSADRLIQCEACKAVYDQDENACRNMLEGRTTPSDEPATQGVAS